MTSDFLFVYGTLRKQLAHPMSVLLASYAQYVSSGVLQGLLYEVAGYPGAIESDNSAHRIMGDVYQITNAPRLRQQLDEYEECTASFPIPHEYIRKLLTITLPDKRRIPAWVYVYNWDVTLLQPIISGDYTFFTLYAKH